MMPEKTTVQQKITVLVTSSLIQVIAEEVAAAQVPETMVHVAAADLQLLNQRHNQPNLQMNAVLLPHQAVQSLIMRMATTFAP